MPGLLGKEMASFHPPLCQVIHFMDEATLLSMHPYRLSILAHGSLECTLHYLTPTPDSKHSEGSSRACHVLRCSHGTSHGA